MAKVVIIEGGRGRKRKPPRRMTPELLWELIRIHSQCVHDQQGQGRCPLSVFVKPLCWEINQAMNLGNEEDRAFRRVDELCAAKPLGERHGALPMRTVYPNREEELE